MAQNTERDMMVGGGGGGGGGGHGLGGGGGGGGDVCGELHTSSSGTL